MTSRIDIERVLDGFLAEGPETVGDPALMRALDAIDQTKQRRGLFAPWRFSLMITLPRLAAAALVAVIAIGGIAYLAGKHAGVGGSTPTPTATNSPSTTAAVAPAPTDGGMPLDTATWTTFGTSRYGYTVGWPDTSVWINLPATEDWAGQTAYDMWASPTNAPWVDKFYNQTTQLTMTAVATTIPVGTSHAAFIDAYQKAGSGTTDSCVELAKDMPQIVIDGHPGLETTKCGGQAGFVAVGPRMYVFSISNQNEVPFLNAYLSTVRLPVETTGWVPFTSADYGFTISHPSSWTAVRATSRFSYSSIQPDSAADVLASKPFDTAGYAEVPADVRPVILASEAKVPSGMTADAVLQQFAIDAYGNACYPSASMLQQITIDGHAATLAYGGCTEQYYFAEASVVIGNRVWIFELRGTERSLIRPFLSTMKLDPSKVVD